LFAFVLTKLHKLVFLEGVRRAWTCGIRQRRYDQSNAFFFSKIFIC